MSGRGNSKRELFLGEVNSRVSLDSDDNDHTLRCKFNFSYFCVQPAGQDFSGWTKDQLAKLLESLRDFSRLPLNHWRSAPVKGGMPILSIYSNFPNKTKFECPPHIPHQAQWGRFRLGSAVRLVGFVVPDAYRTQVHQRTGELFDCNTFYVVFLDANHQFYLTEKR